MRLSSFRIVAIQLRAGSASFSLYRVQTPNSNLRTMFRVDDGAIQGFSSDFSLWWWQFVCRVAPSSLVQGGGLNFSHGYNAPQ
jgi:hypothetical protein